MRDPLDDRAVSTTVGYVIALTISALLVSGLLVAGGGFVDGTRERVVRDELGVVGGKLADTYVDADRLARQSGTTTARVRLPLPDRVAGADYRIRVSNVSNTSDPPYRYAVVLESGRSDVSANVTVRTETPVAPTTLTGGSVVVSLDASGELDVARDAPLVLVVGAPYASTEGW